MPNRKKGRNLGPLQLSHTRITSENTGVTYSLWNTLNSSAQNHIHELLSLPRGFLPIGAKGRLVFGEGNFGKVRLAKRKGRKYKKDKNKFLAVKKTKWEEGKDLKEQPAHKEFSFSQRLLANNIPHVAAVEDLTFYENKLYQFMPLATLGDGENLKKLIANLDQHDRELIIKYVTVSLMKALAAMHAHALYHRDLKLGNILVSHDGEVKISDFGSAVANPNRVANHGETLTVSEKMDAHYFPPEMVSGHYSLDSYYESLDNWRIGLTILRLCGVVTEGEGLLVLHTRLEDQQRQNISNIDQGLLDKIDKTKIPEEIQEVVFGLLQVDPKNRYSADKALQKLSNIKFQDHDIQRVFEILTNSQIAQGIISGIKQAFYIQYVSGPLKEFEKEHKKDSREYNTEKNRLLAQYRSIVKDKLKPMLNNPELHKDDLNKFLSEYLSKERLPKLDQEQFDSLVSRSRLRALKKQTSLEDHRKEFNEETIAEQHSKFKDISKDFSKITDIDKSIQDFLRLFDKIKSLDYFATSYPNFYPVDEHFLKTKATLEKYRKDFDGLAKALVVFLKGEVKKLLKQLQDLHGKDIEDIKKRVIMLKKIQHYQSQFIDMLVHCEIPDKQIRKVKESFQQVDTLNLDTIKTAENISVQPTFEINSPKSSEEKDSQPADTAYVIPNEPSQLETNYVVPPEKMEVSPKQNIFVENTMLYYTKEQNRLQYVRPEDYLENYKKANADLSRTEVANRLGYTNEEILVVRAMVNDFLAANKTQVALRGNNKLTHLAARLIHYNNHQIEITINNVPYQDVTINHLEKLFHSHPSVETKPTEKAQPVPEQKNILSK